MRKHLYLIFPLALGCSQPNVPVADHDDAPAAPAAIAEPIALASAPRGITARVATVVTSARPPVTAPARGYVSDFSWSRLGGTTQPGAPFDVAAYARHPRIAGAAWTPPAERVPGTAPAPQGAPVD